jgi:hypothetical protein
MEAQNPACYRECSAPKPPEQAQQDWEAFCQAVYDLRVKHRIPDLYLVARMVLQYEEGEGQALTRAHFGDELQAEQMVAWALGYEQCQRQERIASVILDAGKALRAGKNRR